MHDENQQIQNENEIESKMLSVARNHLLSSCLQPSWLHTRRSWRGSNRKWLDCCQLLAHISRSCSRSSHRDMREYHFQIRQQLFSSYLQSIALYVEHLPGWGVGGYFNQCHIYIPRVSKLMKKWAKKGRRKRRIEFNWKKCSKYREFIIQIVEWVRRVNTQWVTKRWRDIQ